MPPFLKVAFFVGSAIIAVVTITGCSRSVPPADLIVAAQEALRASDAERVEELIGQIPRGADEWQAGQLLAGEAAFKDDRPEVALKYYLDAARQDELSSDGQLAVFSAAEIYLELGQLSAAEPVYRSILKRQPDNGLTNERMAFLLSMTGRRWEALNHYFVLIKAGDADYRELGLAADVGRAIEQSEFLEKCLQLSPDDKLVRLAVATHVFDEGEPEARELLEPLVVSSPELISAQSMLGELLVDGTQDRFIEWHKSLPPDADQSPDIWFVRGLWARKQSDLNTAADCFWQTVIRTPFHRRAFYMLGQVLIALDDPQAEEIVSYSEHLIDLSQSVDQVLISEGNDQHAVWQTAVTLEALGRTWEACAWGVVGRRRFPGADWPAQIFSRHSHKLNDQLARIEPHRNPVASRAADAVPGFAMLLEKVEKSQLSHQDRSADSFSQAAQIQFADAQVIPFQYFNGADPETKGVRTFEQTGGGVAILDFDLDGTPDVFLPQGSEWRTGDTVPTPSTARADKLFRNIAGREFRDASENLAGPDSGFGQGCSVGDFNNDGFPDVYVANVGRNGLYENMGDGTFCNVTQAAGLTDTSWTASTLMCDLNADDLPDIFDVNYLSGDDVFEKICQGRACSPGVFSGARDRLLINRGDGTFVEVADVTPRVNSKGLGIVAFETQLDRRSVLFIANDQVANYFLRNRPTDDLHNIQLVNDALLIGLAFNDDGLPMACMGIAIDDMNGNNLPDLFVTNFHNEANTLYLQDSPGLFIDATKSAGLQAASIPFTGWGTQALDADLNGQPDLVVANGHVDDYRDEGGEYQMRPQFFRNLGGRFQEMSADDLGPWFAEKYLGRGLARVDWNQDGLPEFIVSNMNSPLSVLENTSTNTGHFLRVRLRATQSARDAIGARVTIDTSDRQVTRQLMAGDGYMASNERVVEFGLGGSDSVDEITIRWPSGASSILKLPPVDATYFVVEGLNLATRSDLSHFTSFPVSSTAEPAP
ncbi:MAG: FG-GAP-like repeat-containing protein [Fuerstiella sp.]